MAKKTPMSSLVNVITVLLVVGAVAWGVVKIRSQWSQARPDTEQVDEGESERAAAAGPEDKAGPAVVEEKRPGAENVEEAAAEVEADAEKEADAPVQDQPDEPEPEQDETPVETAKKQAQGFNLRQIWADLNLTPEEQARLGQGFALAMQKRQNMSEEERQADTARLRAMRVRWEGMSADEQREAMGRMRGRFEDWRQSGRVELPELSLD